MPEKSIVDQAVDNGQYIANVHILLPEPNQFGRHIIRSAITSGPGHNSHLVNWPFSEPDEAGFEMWINFERPQPLGIVERASGYVHKVAMHPIGELAIRTSLDGSEPYRKAVESAADNSFLKLWLGYYAANETKNSFLSPQHPMKGLEELYARTGVREMMQDYAKLHPKDSSAAIKKRVLMSLARNAVQDDDRLRGLFVRMNKKG